MRRLSLVAAASVCAITSLIGTRPADAQIFMSESVSSPRSGWGFDVGVQVAQPVGDFRTNVSHAWGIGSSVRHHFRWFNPLGIRGDFSFLNYGNERQRVPLSSTVNRVLVDMRTSNNIIVVSGGPELALMHGPLRPYVFGFVGYSYFYTESSAGDDDGGSAFARTTNFDDGGLATGGGGGLRIPFRARTTEVAVDAGARYTRNGVRSYLRSGDITDLPDGSLPRTTEADFWQYYVGMSFSLGRRR